MGSILALLSMFALFYFFIIKPAIDAREEYERSAQKRQEENERAIKKRREIEEGIQEMKSKYPLACDVILYRNKRYFPNYNDNNLYKEYCSNKEEFEKIEKEEKEKKALYDFAVKHNLPLINISPMVHMPTGIEGRLLKEKEKKKQQERERAEEEQRRKQQEKETALSKVRNTVSSWNKAHGIVPIYNLFYYYPKTCTNVYIDSGKQQIRRLIWDFKDGKVSVKYKVEKVLKHFFGDNLKHITFVCIPASSANTNNNRYKDFSENLCKSLSMENGFPYINILHEKQPTHLGGESDNDYFRLDNSFFRGKTVILFDDVITRGDSMVTMKEKLEDVGAKVLCGITLGKTVHTDMGTDPYELL